MVTFRDDGCLSAQSAAGRGRMLQTPRVRARAPGPLCNYFTENLYTVVWVYVFPGRRIMVGNCGWFTLSG